MLDKFECHNTRNEVLQLNTATLPLHNVVFSPQPRSSDRPKSGRHGEWPTYLYFGKMLVHIEGDILAQNSSQFNQYKLDLLAKLLPSPVPFQTTRRLGTLYVRLTGQAEDFKGEYTLDGYEIPMEGLSPSRAPFVITLKVFTPYLTGVTTGKYYWVA